MGTGEVDPRVQLGRRLAQVVLAYRLGVTEARAGQYVREITPGPFWTELAGALLALAPGSGGQEPDGEGTEL